MANQTGYLTISLILLTYFPFHALDSVHCSNSNFPVRQLCHRNLYIWACCQSQSSTPKITLKFNNKCFTASDECWRICQLCSPDGSINLQHRRYSLARKFRPWLASFHPFECWDCQLMGHEHWPNLFYIHRCQCKKNACNFPHTPMHTTS